jgi:phosphotriesterase-related protein
MWDPRRYLDTDHGLDEHETFEPSDADDPGEFDLSHPHVMTVLGPIEPDDLGTCLPCERIMSGSDESLAGHASGYLERAASELEAYFTVGGRSMVDISTSNAGRDPMALRMLSQRVPVHLICAAGRHVTDDARVGKIDPAALEAEVVREIQNGVGTSGIKPGLIVLGTSRDGAATSDIVQAVAGAAKQTGHPLMLCGATCDRAFELLGKLEDEGLSPRRVIVVSPERRPEASSLHALARRGAWITINGIGDEGSVSDRERAGMVVGLVNDGFDEQLLLSQGLDGPDGFITSGGGPGWIHLLERFTLQLMDAGASAGLMRTLLIENPSRALTIDRGRVANGVT